MPITERPALRAETYHLEMNNKAIDGQLISKGRKTRQTESYSIPDIYHYVQNRVDITRGTLLKVLETIMDEYKRKIIDELYENPQVFLENLVLYLQQTLRQMMVDGVKYHKINGATYEMTLFAMEELTQRLDEVYAVIHQEKTLYTYITYDSQVEREFAKDCDADSRIKFYFKLPRAFKIPTPLGNYCPDWAVIFQEQDDKQPRLYFVAETKGSLDHATLRVNEQNKIKCGSVHFKEVTDRLRYGLVVTVEDLPKMPL